MLHQKDLYHLTFPPTKPILPSFFATHEPGHLQILGLLSAAQDGNVVTSWPRAYNLSQSSRAKAFTPAGDAVSPAAAQLSTPQTHPSALMKCLEFPRVVSPSHELIALRRVLAKPSSSLLFWLPNSLFSCL